jgi:hypothetical protein
MSEKKRAIVTGVLVAMLGLLSACTATAPQSTAQPEQPAQPERIPFTVKDTPVIIADGSGVDQRPKTPGTVFYFRHSNGWSGATGSTGPFTATTSNSPSQWEITDPDRTEALNASNSFGNVVVGASGGTFTVTDNSGGCVKTTDRRITCAYPLPPTIPWQSGASGASGPSGAFHYPSSNNYPYDSGRYYIVVPHR